VLVKHQRPKGIRSTTLGVVKLGTNVGQRRPAEEWVFSTNSITVIGKLDYELFHGWRGGQEGKIQMKMIGGQPSGGGSSPVETGMDR